MIIEGHVKLEIKKVLQEYGIIKADGNEEVVIKFNSGGMLFLKVKDEVTYK